ncbi:MAG: hypothetical protein KKB37_02510 [Alphaproteobacteria bacterium]|nr:hypothetical protein [Alphaproteobacteria bacterium]
MPFREAGISLLVSFVLFATFLANVVIGASGRGSFLTDIGELITVLASCIFFVAGTLQLEKKQQK